MSAVTPRQGWDLGPSACGWTSIFLSHKIQSRYRHGTGKNCLARAVGAGYGQDTQRPKHPTAASEEPGAKTPGFREPSRSCASPPPKGVGRPPKPRLPSPHIRTHLPRLGGGSKGAATPLHSLLPQQEPQKSRVNFSGGLINVYGSRKAKNPGQ